MPRFDAVQAIKDSRKKGGAQLNAGWREKRAKWAIEEIIKDPNTKHPLMSAGSGRLLRERYLREPQDSHLWLPLVHYWPNYQRGAQGIGSCVGWGAEIACTCLCSKAWRKRRRSRNHRGVAQCSTEYSYGLSRVEGRGIKKPAGLSDGANGSHAARGHKDWGAVLRLDHSGATGFAEHDLREYDVKKEKDWGNYGAGGDNDTGQVQWDGPLDRTAKEHPVKTISVCQGFDDVATAVGGAKCPVTIASMYACSMKRDKYGYSRKQGSWAHQMCIIAVRHGSHPGALCAQSWGPNSASGPSGDEYTENLPSGGTPENILGFTWWMPPEDVDWVCKTGEAIAYGDIDGWKMDRFNWARI